MSGDRRKGTGRLFAAGILLAMVDLATPASAQDRGQASRDLETDRPDKTENPHTMDAGRFQLEMDVATFTSDRDGQANTRTRTLNLAPINLKYGLDDRTDVQLIFDSYLRQSVKDQTTGARETAQGIGDVTLRVKRNLWGNDNGGTALALMPFVKLPTNVNGLGNGSVEFGVIAPVSANLSDRISLAAMTEIDWVEQKDGSGLTSSFVNSASLGFDLTDKLGIYTELFTEKPSDRPWEATFDVGTTLAISDDLQLDAGVNVGLTEAADDVMVFAGLSRRF